MKNLVIINKEVLAEIKRLVEDFYGYSDEWTDCDVVFVVEFALGLTKGLYRPNEYMYDIFDRLGIVEGHVHDEGLIKVIQDTKEEYGYYDEYIASTILNRIREYIK